MFTSPDWTPEQVLLAAVIRRARLDLIFHTGRWQRDAARYFVSMLFIHDCQLLDADPVEVLRESGLLEKIGSVLHCSVGE